MVPTLGADHEPIEDTTRAVEMLRSNRMLDTATIASHAPLTYAASTSSRSGSRSWNVTCFLLLSRPPSPIVLPEDADAQDQHGGRTPGAAP